MRVFTLKNCDTCKKALKWLDANGTSYDNQDIRADGLSKQDVISIVNALGWETAINRRSTTWRGLDEGQKVGLDDAKAIELIAENPTLMKRPVFVQGDTYLAGFDAKAQAAVEQILS